MTQEKDRIAQDSSGSGGAEPEGPGSKMDDSAAVEQSSEKRGSVKRFVWRALKIPLYIVFLGAAVVLILLGVDKMAEIALKSSHLSAVYPHDIGLARRDFTRLVSHYDYDFNPRVCLEYNIAKGNRYEYANNAGFREPTDIPLDKPKDEYRIFLTGGSTAYGLGAVGETVQIMGWYGLEYRETISHMMEMILNSTAPIPGKTIRVYNAAVWGYAYQHNLIRYLTKLRRYKPDLVVSLDGANELPLVSDLRPEWRYFEEGQFHGVLSQIYSYTRPGLSSYLTLWLKNNTFLMAYLWQGRDIFQDLNAKVPIYHGAPPGADWRTAGQSPPDQENRQLLTRNLDTVVRMVENYHSVLQNDGVEHIFALQPWFYLSKKKRAEPERKMGELVGHSQYFGIPSDKTYVRLVERIKKSADQKNYFVVDFSNYFDDVSEQVFTDWCHLTVGANYLLAKELSNSIKKEVFHVPVSDADRIDHKSSFFWNLTATAKAAYAPEADQPGNGVGNILPGYPGKGIYSSKVVSEDEPLELVLDLGRTFGVSRLRIVWADESAVPDEWVFEASVDGITWKALVKADKKQVDNFAWWPGYEFYGAEQVPTRYLRYRPTGSKTRSIRLRTLTAFR